MLAICCAGVIVVVTDMSVVNVALPAVRDDLDASAAGLQWTVESMAGVAGSLASAGRQTGTTLGVTIAGVVVGPALPRGGPAFLEAAHIVWWMVSGVGAGLVLLALLSTGTWAESTAARTTALFSELDPKSGTAAATPRLTTWPTSDGAGTE
ncbi:hypothetical protein K378_04952 [Streptomyces sp. Amel2xB2]|nr:hypothetical protein K378_04952 [Streptomyces sp. Amel2xB2]